jgi:nucleoside-diphosphate-sugar epimerase
LTGGSGFIGRNFLARLDAGHDVFVLGRSAPTAESGARVEWIEHDLARPLQGVVLPERIDAVVHLAQSRRYREFPDGAPDVFAINVRTTFELVEHARRVGATQFVFASTGGLYGHSDDAFVEEDAAVPLDFYLSSKHAAETLLANYASLIRTVVLRFFFVYGPGQGPMVISSLAHRVLARQPVTIVGEPGIRINPIYVDDATVVLQRALAHDRPLLCNVAGAEIVSLTELVRIIGDIAGMQPTIEHAVARHQGDILGDITRARAELGFEPRVTLREGLTRVIDAIRGS